MPDEPRKSTEVRLVAELASLAALHSAALQLLTAPDEATVYALVLDAVAALQGAPMGAVHRLDRGSGEPVLVAQRGLSSELAALVGELANGPRGDHPERLATFGVRAVCAVPLPSGRAEPTAQLHTLFAQPREPHESEAGLVELHVRQASVTLLRMQAEAALARTEATARQLAQSIRDYAIYRLDAAGLIETWNSGGERLVGWRDHEIVGQHVRCLYGAEDRRLGVPEQELGAAALRGQLESEGQRRRKDGTIYWASELISALRDDRGRLTGFVTVSRDLSERRRLGNAARKSEERYRLIFDSIQDYAVLALDPAGRVETWNPGAERIFGWAEADILGQDGAVLFTPEDRARGVPAGEMATAAAQGRAMDERWHSRRDGSQFWASGVMSSLRADDGALLGFVKVCRDLTHVRQVEEQRQRLLEGEQIARLEAERAVATRDAFVGVASHELRTPLAAVLLWTRLLRSGAVQEEQRDMALVAIEQSAAAQQVLVEDLLDVGRTVSGKIELRLRDVDIVQVVSNALMAVTPMAEAKGVGLRAQLDPDWLKLRADPDRLQQVLWNVIQNAVKFTPRGGLVTVVLTQIGADAIVQVSDTGRGIEATLLPHVFELFRQGDASTTRTEGGLGLGLAIARNLVEQHGGTLTAESVGPNRGATFTLRLPLTGALVSSRASAPREAKVPDSLFEPSQRLVGLDALIVEDDPHTRIALAHVLVSSGASVSMAASAFEAVALFTAHLDGGYNALVVDVGLPRRDGFQLVHDVRVLEVGRQAPPAAIIAVTAFTTPEARERGLALGADQWLAKPVDPEALVQALLALTAARRRPDARAGSAPRP